MIGPARHRSSMSRVLGPSNLAADELVMMRRAAWHSQGIVVLRPEDVHDDGARQALINEANRLFGRRPGDGQ